MKINDIPVVGKVNRSINSIVINFVLLGVICLGLGVTIIFLPKVLDVLVAAFLILVALIFLNIAFRIHSEKRRYLDWIDKVK